MHGRSADMSSAPPIFDIFLEAHDKDAQWLESVNGPGAAVDRMREIARKRPGRYFVFSRETHSMLAVVEVSAPATQRKDWEIA